MGEWGLLDDDADGKGEWGRPQRRQTVMKGSRDAHHN